MYNATLINRIEITPDLLILHVKPDVQFNAFLPGQYVALGLLGSEPKIKPEISDKEQHAPDRLIKRAYSIGSSPINSEYLEFYLAVVPDGALSSRLAVLKPGDRLFAAQKITGTFTLDCVPSDHHLVFVATGTGIAPYVSMLRTENTWTDQRKITLIHGVRYPQDLAYKEELEKFALDRGSIFRYLPIVSRAEESYSGMKGRVHKIFDEGLVTMTPEHDHVFLCGNPAMIEELEKGLVEKGFKEHSRKNPGNLHLEKYW